MAEVIALPRALQGPILGPWAAKAGPKVVAALSAAVAEGVGGQRTTAEILADFERHLAGQQPEPAPAWLVKAQRRAALEALIR